MKVFLDMVGCRLNQSEIETYARQFRATGHSLVANPEEADLAVINTCAVTAAGASDSRHKIRQVDRAGVKEIVVTGCWSTLNPQGALALPRVTRVVPNTDKDRLVFDLLQIPEEDFDLEPVSRQPVPGTRLRTRAFIKAQDGCDNRCTFCITTIARGPGRSRSIPEVLADVRAALQSSPDGDGAWIPFRPIYTVDAPDANFNQALKGYGGAKEIVLTGVHLGSWGKDFSPPLHLRQLVEAILNDIDVPRLRLSSLEPWDLDESFFSQWQDPRLCRHLHLPLQSGCAATLRRMARKTTPGAFASLVEAAHKACPDIAITTDVIVGFPGETQEEFAESLDFIRQMEFAGGHVFTYSARPGTAAARMPNQEPHLTRKERNAQVRALLAESACAYQTRFLGRTLPVLWESAISMGPQVWRLHGLTDNYLRVEARAPRHFWNQITPVLLTRMNDDTLEGTLRIEVEETGVVNG